MQFFYLILHQIMPLLNVHVVQTRLSFSRRQTTRMYLECPYDLDTWPWPRYSKDVLAHQKQSLQVKAFKLRAKTVYTEMFIANDLDPMTCIYDLDLDIPTMYLHTKNKVSRSRRSKSRARQDWLTDTQTDVTEYMPHLWVIIIPHRAGTNATNQKCVIY